MKQDAENVFIYDKTVYFLYFYITLIYNYLYRIFVFKKNKTIQMKTIQLFLIATALLFSCAKSQTLSPDVPLAGNWGGEGIVLVASEKDVIMTFDCGSGTIERKVIFSNNKFSEKGTYLQIFGNIPVNFDAKPRPVLYEATLVSDTFNLTMKSEDGKTTLGTYSVKKGTSGKINRCM